MAIMPITPLTPIAPRRRLRTDAGTSVTETMLLTWLILVFVAAALQIFIMNESLFRSLTATHAQMMQDGFKHNHWQYDAGTWDNDCFSSFDSWNTYNTDEHAKEIWRYTDFPEIRVQTLGMFRWWGGPQYVETWSIYPGRAGEADCGGRPCKRIKMGAGAAGPVDEGGAFWSRPVYLPGHIRLYCKAGKTLVSSLQDVFDYLKNF
jgi:hypothetical protein